MRNKFASTITDLAKIRKDIVLLSGDIGNRMFDNYKIVAPERFYNCGIAEGSMMSIASGLGLSGMRPFVYTITPFVTTRCLEQIKIGGCYHKSPITIIGTGSGLSYSELGATHHSFEDIGILRTLPDIQLFMPADNIELERCIYNSLDYDGPSYIRIGKKGEPIIHNENDGKFSHFINHGENIVIISAGPIIGEAIEASRNLKGEGIDIAVVSLEKIKPTNKELLMEISNKYSKWIILEEHSIIGGIADSILDFLNEHNLFSKIKLYKCGIPDKFLHELGNQEWTRKSISIDAKSIEKKIKKIV
tara:strand:+ start:602 stop:1513 length:912 start_codon:yes stop_codon:yes gene_type:complete